MSSTNSNPATPPGDPVGGHNHCVFTVEEFAAITGLSLATVWRWVRERRIPAYRPSPNAGSIRIPCSALDSLLIPAIPPDQRAARRGRSSPAWMKDLDADN